MTMCHCGSGRPYSNCCAPYISASEPAPTAEALMRSRYSAYVEWLGLEILSRRAGQAGDTEGWVEFVASFKEDGVTKKHHEHSRFQSKDGRWYYVDGDVPKPQTQRHQQPKVGRNDPCPCGSGKKYKKCCGV